MKTSLKFHRFSMKKIFLLTSFAFLCNASMLWSATRNVVTGYGADNTGASYATTNIQNAIDACLAGDVLLIPAGTYLMNNGLNLKSDITVIIAPGALVKANTSYVWLNNRSHMFYGLNVSNVTITGGGTIDGGGLVYERGDRTYSRPGRGIQFIGSSNLIVKNLRIQNIPNFAVCFTTSTNVLADNLVIRGRGFFNNSGSADGLDVESSSNVIVQNCDIEVGDDALCIKSDFGVPCHNLRFYNCVIASTCNAFKIGTDTRSDVYDVIADGIIVNKHSNPGTGNPVPTGDCISAIAMQSNDNANVYDITCRNFTINSCYNPISFLLENRQGGAFASNLQDIVMENINCKKTVTQPIVFNSVCADVNKIKNITLKNVTISNYSAVSGVNLSCMGTGYPEVNAYGIADAYGVWARKVDGLNIINCNFINTGASSRPRTNFENTTVTNMIETTGCTIIPIDPFLSVNSSGLKNIPNTSVPIGGTLSLVPEPATGGTWSWTGPNGFTSSSRQITFSDFQANQFGDYVATYTNDCGGINTKTFTISDLGCSPIPIGFFLNVNNTGLQNISSASFAPGGSITFAPTAITGGTWSWTGPNGYSSNLNEITISNIQPNQFGTYTVTYTSSCGEQSSQNFNAGNSSIFQAEDATIINGATNNGATGKYVDLENGGSIKWNVPSATATSYNLIFRMGVPSGTRKMGIFINGAKLGVLTSAVVGFGDVSITASLIQGNNTIELRDTESTSEFNVDYLSIPGIYTTLGTENIISVNDSAFYLYPNPSNGILNIELNGGKYISLDIYTITGALVYSKKLNKESSLRIDLSHVLKSGTYLVSLKSDGKISTKKLIIR